MAGVLVALRFFSIAVCIVAATEAISGDLVKCTSEDSSCVQEISVSFLQKQAEVVKAAAKQTIAAQQNQEQPEAGAGEAESEAPEGSAEEATSDIGSFDPEKEGAPEMHAANENGELVPQVVETAQGSTTAPPKADPNIKCIQHTGGNCMDQACADWRGPTTCSRGRCFCLPGYCATVGGNCIPQQDQQIAHNFTLRNARYPDQYMYISVYRKAVLVGKHKDKQSYFDLFMPPGQGERETGGNLEFFLGSGYSHMWVAAIGKDSDCTSDGYKSNCREDTAIQAIPVKRYATPDILSLAVNIYIAPEYEGEPNNWQNKTQSVMIESYRYPRHFFSLSSLSWGVQATYGDNGAGSYWIPEPPIPVPLKPYVGPRCSFDCGFYGSGASPVLAPMIISSSSCLIFLICCGCICAAPRKRHSAAA